jgi:hypothetical protein
MVHFPRFAFHTYGFSMESSVSLLKGLPHSDICGSKPARDSPQLFAACHVLLRLWLPRHPPYALCSLTINFTFCHRTSSQKCAHLCSYYFPVVPFLFSFQRTKPPGTSKVLRTARPPRAVAQNQEKASRHLSDDFPCF